MADAPDQEAAAASASTPQRTILYARKGAGPQRLCNDRASTRKPLPVPNWFDLPVLLPESNAVGARIQTAMASRVAEIKGDENVVKPKISRLTVASPCTKKATALRAFTGPRTEEEERKVKRMGAGLLKSTAKRRQSTRVRKLDELDPRDRKRRLREKLWKDLSRFGLWPIMGPGDYDDQQSVEDTVDSILAQWQQRATEMPVVLKSTGDTGGESGDDDEGTVSVGSTYKSRVFLTDVPATASLSTAYREKVQPSSQQQLSVSSNAGASADSEAGPEDESNDHERGGGEDDESEQEDLSPSVFGGRRLLQKHIGTPGLERRRRLHNLHQFVGTQLQKRLFKSWDSIEIAFTGSGDMTVSQIVKFLQLSDVQLGATDAAKVQSILEEHVVAKQATQDAEVFGDEVARSPSNQKPGNPKLALLSYEGFRQLFSPADAQVASRWKREFDREKFRHKQEKEIYSKELTALEEKVKQRLANSAKQMVEVLNHFKCDRRAIPWGNDRQRLQLRAQFLEIIFQKPHRRRMLRIENALPNSSGATTPEAPPATASAVPEKLSVKLILSTLLQKYSRNGHFESIEVPVAAFLYHDFAADAIKRSIQGYWASFEIDQWPERQMIFRFRKKKQAFRDWHTFTKHVKLLRECVLRKFVAWKYMARRLHEYYAFYRTTFWPFYTWKRHLQQMIIARGKTTFLMNALRTYIQLRHFRALKKRYRARQWNQRQIARVRKKKARQVYTICWEVWKERFESSLLIRRVWQGQGHVLQQLHKYYMVRITFYVLRYYSILRKDMKRRKYKTFLALFSTSSRAKTQLQHQHQHQGNGQTGKTVGYDQRSGMSSPHPIPHKEHTTTKELGHAQGRSPTNGMPSDDTRIPSEYNGSPHGEPSNAGAATSLTRIMETDLGEKIKRKSRLYDLCLGLYLKYRDRDRGEMTGNVVAYRRFGRIFLNSLLVAVRHGRKTRFATDLGAFRVMNTRFRQWMKATIYKRPSTQEGFELVAEKINGSKKKGDAEVLHWLRDREWRLHGIENNPIQAQQLREDLLVAMANDSVRKETIRDRELLLNKKQSNEDAFLRKEASATLKMKAAQMQQVQQILRRRALRLHDALDHVYDELLQQQSRQQLRSSFRSLRIVVMMKYTSLLCHRAQLRNWLRLCHRFMYWEKHMSEFYKQKVKYHAFQALFKHAVWKWKFQSPGLSVNLQRSKRLMLKYEHFIEQQGLLDGSSSALQLAATKYSPANTFIGIFLRWVQFAQCSRARRNIILLTHRKRQIWLMHTVFHSWKNRMKVKYTYLVRRTHLPFFWRQSMVNLDTYHCSILALEARLPTTQLKATLHRTRMLVQQTAIGSPTLKRLFQRHETEVRQRLQLEKRLMFAAYRDRRVHTYVERSSAIFGASVGVPFMYEKAPPYSSISEIAVISDKKVDGIMLVVKTNASVSLDGTLRGNPFGTREVFTLPKGDKLVAVEGFASQSIYGLRFGTTSGRFSKWFGHCEKGTHFEIRSDYAGKHEEIVGIFGHADSTSLNSLGVVMRHTMLKNPFEGLWLQGDHQLHHQKQQQQEHQLQQPPRRGGDELLCDRQFAYFLQVRTCEVLLIMQRAHLFALRAHRLETTLPSALGNMRVIMALARWLLNALSHGLVYCTDREEEGRQIMQSGLVKHSAGEKLVEEGVSAMQVVDGFRDADGRLDAATLGVKKVTDLREMMTRAQQLIAQGRHQIDEGQSEIVLSQRILPHLPMTKRMATAIRKMYKVVQTKDYIDQMDPELRAILLLKKDTVPADETLKLAHFGAGVCKELVTQDDCLPAICSLKMVQTIALGEAALADGLAKLVAEDLDSLGVEANWWHPRVRIVENWLRDDMNRANLPDDGSEEMIRRHIQRGDFYPQVQIKCWKHIVLELRDLPCFFDEACVKASSHEDTPQVVGTTSPSRGKLRPGKELIVLPDAQTHEPENNASTPDDGGNSNASSSWSLEPLNPDLVPSPAVPASRKPRPNSTASYSTRREPASIDLISAAAAMGKTFSGLSLLERQMEWLRKKQDKMEAERIRQEEENVRELTFQPKLIRRITFSGDKGFKDIASISSARPYSRSESSRRVTETAGATLLKERALPKVPRLAHHRRSKRKTLLQSAAISQPVGVSCKLLDSMKSELEASLATTRSNASSDASTSIASEQSDSHEKQESDPASSGDDGVSPIENNATSKEGVSETEADVAEAIVADDTPAWSAKPTVGGRRVEFDASDMKARLTLRDASKFELSTMYRKTDRRAGREGVALHVGRHEDTLEEQVIAVLFDKEKVSEEDAERWWTQHEHRFVDVLQHNTSALPPVAPRAAQ